MESTYFSLASRNNFNKALRHFFKVTEVVEEVERKRNLADIIYEELEDDEIVSAQILPIVGSVIRDKFNYSYSSTSIKETLSDFDKIVNITYKWTALDILIIYFDSNGKIIPINPKNAEHWERARELTKDQLVVIYVRYLKGENKKLEADAVSAMKELLARTSVHVRKEFVDQNIRVSAPPQKKKVLEEDTVAAAPRSAVSKPTGGKRKITPRYSIQVSNELFHNGNVEAWKKIITSYEITYQDTKVLVFYDNAQINN